ncbi:prepilin-type N-terminal cleavage/methylation domain-containing protein [Carboxydochorda subterranea]|uniref:Prepilin-type N-terminal cleavage/methylation domain-containing protein n=1 Tax=Carboxydichorda subterranea TaxID=3109565 RepID=A0ABZ1BUI5_9FIRM|nr:prepilin-type N-terminal cleavage/methylation domain-containing protein [Limnochorda sp. L945t]WRP16349.1 prepilin-type N-terminal cleavage/methylation domain-containing protein [Limnochorda sp. L945t]
MSLLRNRWRKVLKSLRNDKGFTLMELMVVVAIIAILATGGFVAYDQFVQRAVNSSAQQFAAALRTAVQFYELENNASPADASKATTTKNLSEVGLDTAELTLLPSDGSVGTKAGFWVNCPSENDTTWKVTAVRSGRTSTEVTVTTGIKPPSGACSQD